MKKHSLFAGAAAAALALASILPVANTWANTAEYDGGLNAITITRNVSGVSNPVTNTFTYTITNTDKPSGATVTNSPTSASVVFNNTTPTNNTATKSTTVSFANANYSMIGDYTYTIAETGSTDTTSYPIDTSNNDYTAVVQVRYYVNPSTNVPDTSRYVAYIILENKEGNKIGGADAGTLEATWGSEAARTYFQIHAITTGNAADPSKCFAYSVNIPTGNGVAAGDTFKVTSSTDCTGGAATITAGTAATIYLKHDDTATVGERDRAAGNQMPIGASYTITKTDTSDGYTTTMDGNSVTTVTKTTVATTAANFATASLTEIENNKNDDPLTGIATNVWTYIILMVAGFFGFFLIARRKKDDEEQQQQQ